MACVVRLIQAQQGENWNLPLLYTVSLDLRLVALKAEAANRKYFNATYLIFSSKTSQDNISIGQPNHYSHSHPIKLKKSPKVKTQKHILNRTWKKITLSQTYPHHQWQISVSYQCQY